MFPRLLARQPAGRASRSSQFTPEMDAIILAAHRAGKSQREVVAELGGGISQSVLAFHWRTLGKGVHWGRYKVGSRIRAGDHDTELQEWALQQVSRREMARKLGNPTAVARVNQRLKALQLQAPHPLQDPETIRLVLLAGEAQELKQQVAAKRIGITTNQLVKIWNQHGSGRWRHQSDHTDPRAAEILQRRDDGETLKSIGDSLGVSRERVRQIEARFRIHPKPSVPDHEVERFFRENHWGLPAPGRGAIRAASMGALGIRKSQAVRVFRDTVPSGPLPGSQIYSILQHLRAHGPARISTLKEVLGITLPSQLLWTIRSKHGLVASTEYGSWRITQKGLKHLQAWGL